jgi:DNA polymerase-3 subunit beta
MTMRFTCEKNMLVQGLNIAGRAVASKSSLSVIEGILCQAEEGLSLTGYNMETGITYQIEADVTDPGQCILPAKLFGDIIRRLPEGPVTVVVDDSFKVSIRPATLPLPSPPKARRITRSCRM